MDQATLTDKFSNEAFEAEKYVNTLTVEGVDGLLEERQKIIHLSDETKKALKKNVYANFQQFITASKEISFLEGEMSNLGSKLNLQRNIMTEMMENPVISEKVDVGQHIDEEDSQRNLAFILEKVDGCAHVMEESGRHLVHDGDMVETDDDFNPICKTHMFLLNDSLMVTKWQANTNRHGTKYKYDNLVDLDNIAIVNVRDDDIYKNAIRILMFPYNKIFSVENAKTKRQWLEYIDETKRRHAALNKAKREAKKNRQSNLISPDKEYPPNPFETSMDSQVGDVLNTEGMKEVPEDLDVLIAQRDFQGAVDLIEETDDRLSTLSSTTKSTHLREFRSRIDARIKQLTDILMMELSAPPERTIRTGSNSARTAVTQLIRLNKSSQACQLFLTNRSTVIRYSMRQLKIEGATSLYIKKLSETFFETLRDTCREFYKSFPEKLFGVFSGFVIWAQNELKNFVEVFKRQVFGTKSDVSVIADCVAVARLEVTKLQEAGFDLVYMFNTLIHEDVERCIKEHTANCIEATKQREQEAEWTPHNFSHKSKLNKFLDSMITAGFTDIESHVYDGLYISLAHNTLLFCKFAINFLQDLLKLNQPSVQYLVDEAIDIMWRAQTSSIESALNEFTFIKQETNKFIMKNAKWLEEQVLAMSEKKYLDSVGYSSSELKKIHREFGKIKSLSMMHYQEAQTV